MKLEKWALMAEVVGSFAVVLTLIILIVEIRGNSGEMRAATLANIAARTQALPLAAATNPQFADLWARMTAGEELTPTEEAQVDMIVIVVLKLAEESFIAHRDGRLDDDVWQTRAAFALNILGNPYAREYWKQIGPLGVFIPAFADYIDTALAERYRE